MKALLIWNNLWADRCLDFIHPLPGTSDILYLSCVLKTVSSQCGLSLFLYPSSHLYLWLFPICLVFPASSLTLRLHFAAWVCYFLLSLYVLMAFWSILCFHCFYHLSFPLSVFLPLTLPLHFHFFFTSPPLFTFSLQWGHSMNNSKALQDDNGKLEVRLCVACVCVCVRLVDSFQPGGNCKGLFIHMNYVNKVTLPFKVAKWGGVTADVVVSGRWSNDYRSVVMSTFSPTAISAISQSCFLGKLSKKEKRRRRQCLYRLKGCCNSLRAFDGLLCVLQCAHHNMPFVLCDAKFIHNGDFRNVSPFHDPWSSLLWMEK